MKLPTADRADRMSKPTLVRCNHADSPDCPNKQCEARRKHRVKTDCNRLHFCYCCGSFACRCVKVKVKS